MLDQEQWLFTVTDLKQYIYCPRILYYHACLPDIRPVTYKMQAGIEAHVGERQRAERRSLKMYDLPDGERYFDVHVRSSVLGLSGEVDEIVDTQTELFPVDYKSAQHVGEHFKVQLTAYALMMEEHYQRSVKRGFITLIPVRKTVEIPITPGLRRRVHESLDAMRAIVEQETMPSPTEWQQRCADCEFRRFCNDV